MRTPEIAVRPRTSEDLPALAAVLERVHEKEGYPVTMPPSVVDWLSASRTRASFVAVVDGQVIGQASRAVAAGDRAEELWKEATGLSAERLAVVKRLFVDPGTQGRGAGRRLLEAVVADAHRLGMVPVLDVDAGNGRAQAIYERAGFRPVGDLELTWTGLGGVFLARCYVGPPPPESAGRPSPG